MISFLFYWIDRIKDSILLRYRRIVFLGKVQNVQRDVQILGKVYVNASNIKIGKNVTIYPGVYFWGDGEILIGDNVDIGVGTIIFSKSKIIIGNNVSIAGHCYIIDSNHSISREKLINKQELDFDEQGIMINDDVWIAAGCKVLKGAKINEGAVIGAMSLVNSEIAEFGIAVGIPAKVKKYRSNI